MLTRKTKYGWMALGGMLCLFGVVLACKMREGNRASAQTEDSTKNATVADPTKGPAGLTPVKDPPALPPIGVPLPDVAGTSVAIPPVPPPPPPPSKADSGEVPAPLPLGNPNKAPASGSGSVTGVPSIPAPVGDPKEGSTLPPPSSPIPPPPGATASGSAAIPPPPPSVEKEAVPPPPPGVGLPPPPSMGMSEKAGPPPAMGSDTRPILIPASGTAPSGPASAPPPAPLPPVTPPPAAPGGEPPPAGTTPPVDWSRVPTPGSKPEGSAPGEPPLAPTPGPVIELRVKGSGETFKTLARRHLGTSERWSDLHKLNPSLKPEAVIPPGTIVRLPGDACVQDDSESVKPLPSLRPRPPVKAKVVLPLTGTFQVNLDDKQVMTLPRAVLAQLGNSDTLLVSPGPDKCLWLTNHAHLDRLTTRLENSPAREADLRVFKRLYYAQTIKVPMKDGRVALTERLAQFAGLQQELVLVGIDDHFEIWDAGRWRRYTQAKKATPVDAE